MVRACDGDELAARRGYSPSPSSSYPDCALILKLYVVAPRDRAPRSPSLYLSAGSGTAMEERPRAPGSILRTLLGPFPRVFAAGAVASGSVAADSEVLAEDQRLPPSYAPEAQRLESGWDRLRGLFARE